MADVPLQVTIRIDNKDVKRALRGMTREFEQSEKRIQRHMDKTEGKRKRGFRDMERDARRTGDRVGRELGRGIENGTKRGIQRSRTALQKFGLVTGALAVGGAQVARKGYDLGSTASGSQGMMQRIRSAREFDFDLTRLTSRTGLNKQTIQNQILSATAGTTATADQALRGAEVVQERIGAEALPEYFASLKPIIRMHEGLGVSVEDLAATTVELKRQFNIAEEDIPRALGLLAEQAELGSIEFGNMSNEFRKVMGTFVGDLDQGGLEGLREFGAAAQLIGQRLDSSMAATSLLNLITQLTNKDTMKKLRKAGVNQSGGLISTVDSIGQKNLSPTQLQEIFGNERGLRALKAMLDSDPVLMNQLLGANAQTGLARADAGATAIRGTVRGKDLMRQSSVYAENIKQVENAAVKLSEFSSWIDKIIAKNPGTAMGGQMAVEGVKTLGILAILRNLTKAKGVASPGVLKGVLGGGAGGMLSGVGGKMVAALSAAGPAIGLLGAGAAGFGVGTAANRALDIENWLNNLIGHKIGGDGVSQMTADEYRRLFEEQLAAQKQIADGIKEMNSNSTTPEMGTP